MASRFRHLSEAYEVLRDAAARQSYDEERAASATAWQPGDGRKKEDMEAETRKAPWKEVLEDTEVLRQAREEYWEDLRLHLGEAAAGASKGDFVPLRQFVQDHWSTLAGGVLIAVPVFLATRSPGMFLLAVKRLLMTEALITKAVTLLVWPFVGSLHLDLPGRIWRARVALAKRTLERQKARRSAHPAAAPESARGDGEAPGWEQPAHGATGASAPEGRGGAEVGSAQAQAPNSAGVPGDAVAAAPGRATRTRGHLPPATGSVPNLVYLDDSTSMLQYKVVPDGTFSMTSKFRWENTCLEAGQKALAEVAGFLEGTPTRVVKFGGITVFDEQPGDDVKWISRTEMLRTLLLETRDFRGEADLGVIQAAWDGSSQGTFMWKMMETDILETYNPSNPIRVHLITDGVDTHSPAPFDGIRGMEVLKASLRERGFRIQWNIILLLYGAHCFDALTVHKYGELCASSGGAFYIASDRFESSAHRLESRLEEQLKLHSTDAARQQFMDHLLEARSDAGDGIELPRLAAPV